MSEKLTAKDKRVQTAMNSILKIIMDKSKGNAHEAVSIAASIMSVVVYKAARIGGVNAGDLLDQVCAEMKSVLAIKQDKENMH